MPAPRTTRTPHDDDTQREQIVPRIEHLEDRQLLSVSPAYYPTGPSYNSYGHSSTPVLMCTNTNDSGPGSLHYECSLASSSFPGGTIIEFNFGGNSASYGYGHYSSPVVPVIVLTSGPIVVSSNLTIDGITPKGSQSCFGGTTWVPGCGTSCPTTGVTITQNVPGGSSLFDITNGVVQMNGLSFLGGNAGTGSGGACVDTDSSTVTFQNDVFTGNSACTGGANLCQQRAARHQLLLLH